MCQFANNEIESIWEIEIERQKQSLMVTANFISTPDHIYFHPFEIYPLSNSWVSNTELDVERDTTMRQGKDLRELIRVKNQDRDCLSVNPMSTAH